MWSSFSNAIPNFGRKKNSVEPSTTCSEFSDEETSSNARTEEGLDCPICWESFNVVENVPYVLWCGHTLCKNCLLGLNLASLKLFNQQIQIPFFVSCPWCNLLTLRSVCEGNLKFPCKNFFLLWMVESLNGERMKSPLSIRGSHQSAWSPRNPSAFGNQASDTFRRASFVHRPGRSEFSHEEIGIRAGNDPIMGCLSIRTGNDAIMERSNTSLQKSLDFFIQLTTKSPLVITLLALVVFVLPASAVILVLYLLITVLVAVPSFLVLYLAYPCLRWLIREISS